MKYNIENVTEEDIAIATKVKVTFGELKSTYDLVKIIKNKAFTSDDPIWEKICMVSYAYKLGQMQGKREERARRRKKQYIDNRKVLEEQRKLLAEIDNLAANRKVNNMAKCAELENEFYKLLKTLKDKTISGGLNGPTI